MVSLYVIGEERQRSCTAPGTFFIGFMSNGRVRQVASWTFYFHPNLSRSYTYYKQTTTTVSSDRDACYVTFLLWLSSFCVSSQMGWPQCRICTSSLLFSKYWLSLPDFNIFLPRVFEKTTSREYDIEHSTSNCETFLLCNIVTSGESWMSNCMLFYTIRR